MNQFYFFRNSVVRIWAKNNKRIQFRKSSPKNFLGDGTVGTTSPKSWKRNSIPLTQHNILNYLWLELDE